MKETFIITIESKSPKNFGVNFMRGVLYSVINLLNGYKKCYKATMTKIEK